MRRFLNEVSKPKLKYATIKDVKANNTAGGGATTGSFLQTDLNTLDDADNIGITLSANRFTLPPGKYYFSGSRVFHAQVDQGKIILVRDPAGSPSNEIIGLSTNTASTIFTTQGEFLHGIVEVTSNEVFEVQYRVTSIKATDGLGIASNFSVDEVYSQYEIIRFS